MSAPSIAFIAILALVATGAGDLLAFTITQDAGSQQQQRATIGGVTFTVTLDPLAVTHLEAGATPARRALFDAAFDGLNPNGTPNAAINWTFNAGNALDGVVTISQCDAFIRDPVGGAIIDLNFNGPGAPVNLRWIQVVDTNRTIGNEGNPSVDPPTMALGGDDNSPFYFTALQTAIGAIWEDPLYDNPSPPNGRRPIQNPANNVDLVFLDQAERRLARAPVDFDAFLYLVTWDIRHGGTVTIHDGVHWGFTIGRQVPEPSTILLLLGLAVPWMARQRHMYYSRRQKQAAACARK